MTWAFDIIVVLSMFILRPFHCEELWRLPRYYMHIFICLYGCVYRCRLIISHILAIIRITTQLLMFLNQIELIYIEANGWNKKKWISFVRSMNQSYKATLTLRKAKFSTPSKSRCFVWYLTKEISLCVTYVCNYEEYETNASRIFHYLLTFFILLNSNGLLYERGIDLKDNLV